MFGAFMDAMVQMKNDVKKYPDGEIRLDNADFVKLVELAEQTKTLQNEKANAFRIKVRGLRIMEEEIEEAKAVNNVLSRGANAMKIQNEMMQEALKHISGQGTGGVYTHAFQVLEQIKKVKAE